MKLVAFLAMLISAQCLSCELASVDEARKDVEEAFLGKSFSTLSEKYGGTRSIALKVENEYNEDTPVSVHRFKDLSELSTWFINEYHYVPRMLIPEQHSCRTSSCEYTFPPTTTHHALYLFGFKIKKSRQCTRITEIYVYEG